MRKKPAGIHHVEINVSDLKRSLAFWRWFLKELGYSRFQKWKSGESWKLGGAYIVFVQTEPPHLRIPYHRRRTGLNHLAFHAESREQVDEVTAEVRKRKMNVLYEDKHPYAGGKAHYALFFEDPDRIKVELVAP